MKRKFFLTAASLLYVLGALGRVTVATVSPYLSHFKNGWCAVILAKWKLLFTFVSQIIIAINFNMITTDQLHDVMERESALRGYL
ncbi:MAG: hypothetical protein LBR97_02180 [Dysgonamonadaceae bacterium]|jgi:hypothetical protein|nr:hypothetical protein [Dysgonamonadaceae bacterium]